MTISRQPLMGSPCIAYQTKLPDVWLNSKKGCMTISSLVWKWQDIKNSPSKNQKHPVSSTYSKAHVFSWLAVYKYCTNVTRGCSPFLFWKSVPDSTFVTIWLSYNNAAKSVKPDGLGSPLYQKVQCGWRCQKPCFVL